MSAYSDSILHHAMLAERGEVFTPPKPMPPKPVLKVEPTVIETAPEAKEKPKYVLKPHLTERPLKGHKGLQGMLKQMEEANPPRRGQRRNLKEKK